MIIIYKYLHDVDVILLIKFGYWLNVVHVTKVSL